MLISGGEFLVKSAISIAKKFNISPFVVGITIVSFGTSAPELMVSLQATFDGATGLAIGNVIGSNIANIGLVLGLTVLVKPIIVEKSKYVFSAWFMLISALLFSISRIIEGPYLDNHTAPLFAQFLPVKNGN